MTLFANAELGRNITAQLRPRKLLMVAAICLLLSVCITYAMFFGPANRAPDQIRTTGEELLGISFYVQALILGAGGSIACLNNVFREKDRNSFDFQRLTRLTPLELTLGKLFGAPALMYFICLCFLPITLVGAIAAHARITFFLAAYVALFVSCVALHSLALVFSVLSIRGSQTGGIILLLIFFWLSSFGGVYPGSTFHLGPLGPYSAPHLAVQRTWDVMSKASSEPTVYYGFADEFFDSTVHHFPVLVVVDTLLAAWFLLAVVRNIKRDPAQYELYSPGQFLLFALFSNILLVGFFNWHQYDKDPFHNKNTDYSYVVTLLALNIGVFTLLGLALLRNRERERRILHLRGGAVSLLERLWPAPPLLVGTLAAGALILARSLTSASVTRAELPIEIVRVLFFSFWLIRDFQFLQWAGMRRGKNSLTLGVIYLAVYYICTTTVLEALHLLDGERFAFSGFFLPTAVFSLDQHTFYASHALWIAALVFQVAVAIFFVTLRRGQLAELSAPASAPAPAAN